VGTVTERAAGTTLAGTVVVVSLETWELRPLYEDLVSSDLVKVDASGDRWREIVTAINTLKSDPYGGKPLVYQPLMGGDLSDCRSLAVTDLRVVYRVLEAEHVVEIIAVGVRQGSLVYKLALDRLGRRKRRSPRWGTRRGG
jgi:mRNA-degrading endonuclease RelE of RelBE toxin-antitoxin system